MSDQPKNDSQPPMTEAQFVQMMQRIESANAGQELYARKQYRMSQITAAASVLVLAVVLYGTAARASATLQNMDAVMENLEDITSDLAQSDLQQMIADVDGMVSSSEKSVRDALDKINRIDIDTLNQAIQNLNDTVEPLANFFGLFP